MKNWMKGIFTLVLLTGIVSVVAVSCSDDDDEIVCAEANATKVTLGPNCQVLVDMICACSPLPTSGGLSEADCALAKKGEACVTPEDPADETFCKTTADELNGAVKASGVKDVCALVSAS